MGVQMKPQVISSDWFTVDGYKHVEFKRVTQVPTSNIQKDRSGYYIEYRMATGDPTRIKYRIAPTDYQMYRDWFDLGNLVVGQPCLILLQRSTTDRKKTNKWVAAVVANKREATVPSAVIF